MKQYYFLSDPHFFHKNVIQYSNRPFHNVDEMNWAIINNINEIVKPDDELYILGDFIFGSVERAEEILSVIVCKNLHYIFGNHDRDMDDPRLKRFFKSMGPYKEIKVPDEKGGSQMIVLCHYPILEWNKGHRGSWMLHGHCHGNLKYPDTLKNKRITDVGVDCWNYKPVSYSQLKSLFKKCEDITHHGD